MFTAMEANFITRNVNASSGSLTYKALEYTINTAILAGQYQINITLEDGDTEADAASVIYHLQSEGYRVKLDLEAKMIKVDWKSRDDAS